MRRGVARSERDRPVTHLIVDLQDHRLSLAFGDDALEDPRALTRLAQLSSSRPEAGSGFRWDGDLGRWTDR